MYCSNNPTATLFVRNTGLSTSTTGIWSESIETAGYFSGNGFGIKARAGALANLSVGVAASANSGNFSVGVFGEANGASNTNYGVRGVAEVVTTARNIGVFGRGRNGSINWGGYFQGDVFCSTGNYLGSDSIIKQNIQPLNQALATLKQLQPKTFEYNPTIHPSSNFPTGIQYGLIAQDVKLVLPGLVKDGFLVDDIDSNGVVIDPGMDIKTLNYNGFIPFLIQGVKELDAQVNDIRDSIIVRDSTISRNDSLINDINNRTLSDGTLKNNVTPLT
ncbi:MAG: tail fiber domain-containing protein, partial [bacterium]|nr:tail fiber domain-containing protein [bacterium]